MGQGWCPAPKSHPLKRSLLQIQQDLRRGWCENKVLMGKLTRTHRPLRTWGRRGSQGFAGWDAWCSTPAWLMMLQTTSGTRLRKRPPPQPNRCFTREACWPRRVSQRPTRAGGCELGLRQAALPTWPPTQPGGRLEGRQKHTVTQVGSQAQRGSHSPGGVGRVGPEHLLGAGGAGGQGSPPGAAPHCCDRYAQPSKSQGG